MDKRLTWLLDVINSHLEPVDPESMEGDHAEHWVLDEHGLRDILRHLFKALLNALANPASRSGLVQRHGSDTIDDISAFLDQI